jgi:hypothetical protein
MTQVPTEGDAKLLEMKLFNNSFHHYTLDIKGSDVSITSNQESQDFNVYRPIHGDTTRMIGDQPITGFACFGNQHPEAVVRDMLKLKRWDEQTLREYSMFTIGDFLILTKENIYFSVNGDLTVKTTAEGFHTEKGQK